jgi:hypothetical protein
MLTQSYETPTGSQMIKVTQGDLIPSQEGKLERIEASYANYIHACVQVLGVRVGACQLMGVLMTACLLWNRKWGGSTIQQPFSLSCPSRNSGPKSTSPQMRLLKHIVSMDKSDMPVFPVESLCRVVLGAIFRDGTIQSSGPGMSGPRRTYLWLDSQLHRHLRSCESDF